MRSAEVFVHDVAAASLSQDDDGNFLLRYHRDYLERSDAKPISLSLPLADAPYHSESLFAYFFNLLPEGSNKRALCTMHRIDADDYFSILLRVAGADTIGAVRVVPKDNPNRGDA